MGTMVDLDELCGAFNAAGMDNTGAMCRRFAAGIGAAAGAVKNGQQVQQVTAIATRQSEGCGCGGACGGGGCGGACGLPQQRPFQPQALQQGNGTPGCGPVYTRPGAAMPPKCYDCSAIDECLAEYLYDAQLRLTPWEYDQLRVRENPLVNLDKTVGSAPFQNFPLTAGTAGVFAQADSQILPYRPLAVKAQPEWSGTPANSKVILTFYAGPAGLTNLANTDALVQIGSPFKLSNFTCADDCYFGPFPEFESCKGSAIPYGRSIYVKIEVGAVGQSVLNGLGLELIKHKTLQANVLCGNFKWFCA